MPIRQCEAHLARMRKIDPAYAISADGVHPHANGHDIIFLNWRRCSACRWTVLSSVDAATGSSGSPGVSGVKVGLGKLEFNWKAAERFPRTAGPIAWPTWKPWPAAWAGSGWPSRDFQPASTLLTRRSTIGAATADEWKKGIDLTKRANLSTNKRTAELWDLVQKRQPILGLAWLTDVDHKCPGTRRAFRSPML